MIDRVVDLNDRVPRKPKPPDERIRDWPRLTVSIRDGVKRALTEASNYENRSPWETVEAAIRGYVDTLPARQRARIRAFMESPDAPPERLDTVSVEILKEAAPVVEAFLKLWLAPKDKLDRSARIFIADVLGFPVPERREK